MGENNTFVGAVLLDTRSIQKYVFGCNELKTNVGASYIVDKLFEELMCNKVLESEKNVEKSWRENEKIKMLENPALEYEVAYIGGGNMLLLVRQVDKSLNENIAKCYELVQKWSRLVLLYAPGLKTGAAVGKLDISDEGFKNSLDELYKQLKENQNKVFPNVDLPYTGLTKECDISGKTADWYDYSRGEKRMVSSEVIAKMDAYKDAKAVLRKKLDDLFPDTELDYVDEFEKMGYIAGESYLSVIHIDGNNMGVKFSCCKNIQERKQLSQKVQTNVAAAFNELLQKIVIEYDTYKDFLAYDVLTRDEKRLLPIRPIIIGGDDITFVCPGRLGIAYAKYFIEQVNKMTLLTDEQHSYMTQEVNKDTNIENKKRLNKNLSCCAGVAIVPAKYPFFRAYRLAEQLCSAAKGCSRINDDSWLDFAILHGEMTPELEQLRQQQYVNLMGKELHCGPYQVVANGGEVDNPLNVVIELAYRLNDEDRSKSIWERKAARNKVKKLREVLCGDMHGITRFLEKADDIEKILKAQTNKREVTADDFWENRKGKKQQTTKFVDAIELIDFLPIRKADR